MTASFNSDQTSSETMAHSQIHQTLIPATARRSGDDHDDDANSNSDNNSSVFNADTIPTTHADASPMQGLTQLTIEEQKAAVVDRELDAQGMGRYQWMVFWLCGFGYLLDLLWAQACGLVVTPMQNEFGFDDTQLGNIFTSFSVGLTVGAFVWGLLVDIIGRSAAFNYTVLISSVFGVCLGLPRSYPLVLLLTALTGFGIGGNIPIDTTICLECLPHNRRWLLPALSVFQPVGVILCSGLAYALIPPYSCVEGLVACRRLPSSPSGPTTGVDPPPPPPSCCSSADNPGWRYLMFTIGTITFLVWILRFLLFRFQESPKFLLSRGRDDEVVQVLQFIARYNNNECHVTSDTFRSIEVESARGTSGDPESDESSAAESALLGTSTSTSIDKSWRDRSMKTAMQRLKVELSRFKLLFSSWTMARLVILVWIIYGFDFWGFTIAGAFLPTILARKGHELGLSITDTYRSYIYIYICGVPGVLVGTVIYEHRRLALLVSSASFGACLFLFTAVHDQATYIAVNGLVYFFQSMFNAVLYAWTPEAFPAAIRGTACGLSSFSGRIFSIVAPIAATRVLAVSLNGVLFLAGASVWVCTVAIALLPRHSLRSQNY